MEIYGPKDFINKGIVLVLGNNQDGCLLTGDKKDVTEISHIKKNNFIYEMNSSFNDMKIESGLSSCGLISKNIAFLWGKISEAKNEFPVKFEFHDNYNNVYQNDDKNGNVNDDGLYDGNHNIIEKLKIGDSHFLFLIDGKVYSYGQGNRGELGLGENLKSVSDFPKLVDIKVRIKKIYAGVRSSFIIDINKNVYGFGCNRSNELGLLNPENKKEINLLTNFYHPVLIDKLENIDYISFGLKHTIFVGINNTIYGCGDNGKGCLGIESCELNRIKNELCVLEEIKWQFDEHKLKKVKCGWNNTFVLTYEGKLYSVGYGKFGQLGYISNNKLKNIAPPEYCNKFQEINFPNNAKIEKIISGTDFFFAVAKTIDNNNSIYSWGWNEHYNLGLNHNQNVFTPELIISEVLKHKVDYKNYKVRQLLYAEYNF